VLHIRPEPPDIGLHRLAILGMRADQPRQREQVERLGQIDAVGGQPARQGGTLGLGVFLAGLAELDVRPEAADAQGDGQAVIVMAQQTAIACQIGRPLRLAQGAGVAAFGVVRAADEGAELAGLEAESRPSPQVGQRRGSPPSPRSGNRCGPAPRRSCRAPRRCAGPSSRRWPRRSLPEPAQQRLPVGAPAGNLVELLLQRRR
jgi:hypothetical protein